MAKVRSLDSETAGIVRKVPHLVDSVELNSPARNGRLHEEVEVHGITDRSGPEGRRGGSTDRRADP